MQSDCLQSSKQADKFYNLANTARGKLLDEVARTEHNLRIILGHATFLDSLMFEIIRLKTNGEK